MELPQLTHELIRLELDSLRPKRNMLSALLRRPSMNRVIDCGLSWLTRYLLNLGLRNVAHSLTLRRDGNC